MLHSCWNWLFSFPNVWQRVQDYPQMSLPGHAARGMQGMHQTQCAGMEKALSCSSPPFHTINEGIIGNTDYLITYLMSLLVQVTAAWQTQPFLKWPRVINDSKQWRFWFCLPSQVLEGISSAPNSHWHNPGLLHGAHETLITCRQSGRLLQTHTPDPNQNANVNSLVCHPQHPHNSLPAPAMSCN